MKRENSLCFLLFLTFLFSAFLFSPIARCELVSHFTFDGTLEDQGPGGNDGTFFGGEPVFVEGYDGTPNGALSFDGIDDYVDVSHVSGLPIYAEPSFTIALWVKGLPQPDRRVFSESSSTNNSPLFNIGTDSSGATGVVDIYIRADDGTQVVRHRKSVATAFDDEWHHICYVDDNGQVTLYIDGFVQQVNFSYTRPVLTVDRTTIGAIIRDARTPVSYTHLTLPTKA